MKGEKRMNNKKQNWFNIIRWSVAVLFLVAALQQTALFFMWNGVSTNTLTEELQTEYLPKQAQALSTQLAELAEAAGVQATDTETIESRLTQAMEAQLNQSPLPEAKAGTEMKEQIQQQLAENQLEPTQEIAAKMDLLEAEGNQLEQQAMEQPFWEQLKQYVQQTEQKKAIIPTIFWILGLATLAIAGLCLPKFKLSFLLSGLTIGGMLSAIMVMLMKSQITLPILQMGGVPEEMMINNALQAYFAPLQINAAIFDTTLSLISVVLAIVLVIIISKKKNG